MGEAPALLARRIASALMLAKRPLVVSGSGLGSAAVVSAAAAVLSALLSANQDARISLVFPEANSLGAAMLSAGGLESAGRALAARRPRGRRVADPRRSRGGPVTEPRSRTRSHVEGRDVDRHRSLRERDHQGRRHSPSRVDDPRGLGDLRLLRGPGPALLRSSQGSRSRSGRMALAGCASHGARRRGAGGSSRSRNLDDIDAAIARELPELASLTRAAPASSFRLVDRRIARGASRESGRTSMHANVDPREPDPATDPDSALSYSMEGPRSAPPSLLSALLGGRLEFRPIDQQVPD